MDGVSPLLLHLLWIVPLVLLIVFLSSPRFRGDIAETRVRRILATGLEKNRYTVFNDFTLPSGGGTTRFDHVVVSKYGIIVIESEYTRGWTSGTAVQERWTRHRLGRKERFPNPMHRNRLQVEALQRLLGFPPGVFQPLVVLVGSKGFRQQQPVGVLEPEKLLAWMRRQSRDLLTAEQAQQATRFISEARLRPTGGAFGKWDLVRLLLSVAVVGGVWLAFHDQLGEAYEAIKHRGEVRSSPESFHADGSRKSEQELWEDSLVCAYSADTGRCSCYEPGGARVDLSAEACRELAERGSILSR